MSDPNALTLFVPGMPQTKGSWRVVMRRGRPSLIPDNEAEPSWAALVAWMTRNTIVMNSAMWIAGTPSRDRFTVTLEFVLLPPPSKRRTNRRDIDKLVRSVLDALTGIVWADDEQVEDLHVSKRVGIKPGVVIRVEAKQGE